MEPKLNPLYHYKGNTLGSTPCINLMFYLYKFGIYFYYNHLHLNSQIFISNIFFCKKIAKRKMMSLFVKIQLKKNHVILNSDFFSEKCPLEKQGIICISIGPNFGVGLVKMMQNVRQLYFWWCITETD